MLWIVGSSPSGRTFRENLQGEPDNDRYGLPSPDFIGALAMTDV
jgi:hypothetical protein